MKIKRKMNNEKKTRGERFIGFVEKHDERSKAKKRKEIKDYRDRNKEQKEILKEESRTIKTKGEECVETRKKQMKRDVNRSEGRRRHTTVRRKKIKR